MKKSQAIYVYTSEFGDLPVVSDTHKTKTRTSKRKLIKRIINEFRKAYM